MQKLMKQHRKFLAGKAGFSLVELIIVIAIMAALVAILAPQYIKYVEKSRVSADETVLNNVLEAVQVAAADTDEVLETGEITITNTGVNYGDTNIDADEYLTGEIKLTSSTYKTSGGTIQFTVTDGTYTFDPSWD